MRPAFLKTRWIAATLCVAAFGHAMADDGVFRLSDKTDEEAEVGIVRISHSDPEPPRTVIAPPDSQDYYRSNVYSPDAHFTAYARLYGLVPEEEPQQIQPTSYSPSYSPSYSTMTPQDYGTMGIADAAYGIPADVYGGDCNGGDCYGGWGMESGGCNCGQCNGGSCQCNNSGSCDGDCEGKRMPNREFKKLLKSQRDCRYGNGYQKRLKLLAGAVPYDSCNPMRWPKRFWRGQQMNYLARNQHLSNALFGWMIPSGCGGQGCPPVGKYQVTYADDPGYANGQDQMKYGAQGYGTHVTVPLAPTVRYGYNYSWGTPSSRLTPIGTYDPQTSPQPLLHRSF